MLFEQSGISGDTNLQQAHLKRMAVVGIRAGSAMRVDHTVYSLYKHRVGTGHGMLITNLCLYREKIPYITKQTKETRYSY